MLSAVSAYCNKFKIKYFYLDKVFNGKLHNGKGKRANVDTVNIFINFESLYNGFRNEHTEKHILSCNKKEVKACYRQCISDFINVAAHYRAYFTRNGIKTNIIYYYNEIPSEYIKYNNSALCDTYRNHFVDSLNNIEKVNVNAMVVECIPIMETIVEYLENVYLVSTKRVESSLIPMVINMESALPANINILITKDTYDFQYVNHNFLVITKNGDDPILLSSKNVIKYMCYKNIKEFDVEKERDYINNRLLPFILACMGDRKRSIPKVNRLGFKTVYKNLESLYKIGYIFDEDPETMSIGNLMHVINNESFVTRNKVDIGNRIMSNYRVTDLISQYSVMNNTQKNKIIDQLVDKSDIGTLMEINNKWFEDYPIHLVELNQYKGNDMV